MKTFKSCYLPLFAVLATLMPLSSMALPFAARSIIYFDAHDNIIGQQVLYCNNISHHGGQIDPSNAYRVEEEFSCGDRSVTCSGQMMTDTVTHEPTYVFNCEPGQSSNYSEIVYFRSALGYSQAQYCQSSGINGAFAGHPSCGLPAPTEVPQSSYPYLNGWNP